MENENEDYVGFYAGLRLTVIIGSMLVYVFTMTHIMRNQIAWLPASVMGVFIFTMVAGLAQKIRPGTSVFWKSFGAVAFILGAPFFAISKIWALGILLIFSLGVVLVCIRAYPVFKEETWGWRAFVLAGLFLAVWWMVSVSLQNAGILR
jgi:hypothetical protein